MPVHPEPPLRRSAGSGRPRLLLYLSRDGDIRDAAVIPTLAALARRAGIAFDAYRQRRSLGRHCGGGDPARAPRAALMGATLVGGRTIEAAASLAARYDVLIASLGSSILEPCLRVHGAELLAQATAPSALYEQVREALGIIAGPEEVILIAPVSEPALEGLEYYVAPLVLEMEAMAFLLDDAGWADWVERGGETTVVLSPARSPVQPTVPRTARLLAALEPADDYAAATRRIVGCLQRAPEGLLLGDPALVAHSLPVVLARRWAAMYGLPLSVLGDAVEGRAGRGGVVFGRVAEDADFFWLSEKGLSLQVIDPGRPPFAASGGWAGAWSSPPAGAPPAGGVAVPPSSPRSGEFPGEPTDLELLSLGRSGAVLVSLAFWAGAIREIETLYALLELVSVTELKCGIALTSGSYEMGAGVVSLLEAPLEAGGVFPLVEPLLGSAGDGVAVEALMAPQLLEGHLRRSMDAISALAPAVFVPSGWWCTMDARLRPRAGGSRVLAFGRTGEGSRPTAPVRVRYTKEPLGAGHMPGGASGEGARPGRGASRRLRRSMARLLRGSGAERFFEARRPFEHLEPGEVPEGVWEAASAAGLRYALTKSAFGVEPVFFRGPSGFVAINHTAGRWDGWTPFETVNDISDLESAERRLLGRGRPGWVLSSVDTCLWAFSGELWHQAGRLREIAEFCAAGGRAGRLVPALPRTIARYARLCADAGFIPRAGTVREA